MDPKMQFPVRIPNMKIVCERFGNCSFSQTKSHSVPIVSVNTERLNSWPVHCESHLSSRAVVLSGAAQLNSIGGAKKMMPIWKQRNEDGFNIRWWQLNNCALCYLVPGYRKFEHENDKTGEELPFANGSHQVHRVILLVSFR